MRLQPRRRASWLAWVAVLLVMPGVFACGGSQTGPTPTPAPSPQPLALTGTWTGTGTDDSGPGTVTWNITQTGTAITGTFSIRDNASGATATGNLSGTLADTTLTYTLDIPVGGFSAPFEVCSGRVTGTAPNVTGTAINATYTGTICGDRVQGSLSLTR